MDITKSRYDITSADTKILGTDFQFFYFIKELLKLKKGQQIGYECKDDVHIDLPNDQVVLIQVKHTTLKDAKGNIINLGDLDDDLIHTLENWIDVICDPFFQRNSIPPRTKFVINTKFILVTNKNITNNEFISQIEQVKLGKNKLDIFIMYITDLLKKTQGIKTRGCLQKILNLDKKLCEKFLSNIFVVSQLEDVIEEIKIAIEEKYIKKSKLNDAFNDIFSEMKLRFFKDVKAGEKLIVSFDEWAPCASTILEKYRSTLLPIKQFERSIPAKLQEQEFIKELINIGDVNKDNIVKISTYTNYMLDIKMNLDELYNNGDITNDELKTFHSLSATQWENTHKKVHRKTLSEIEDTDNALSCLDEIREKKIELENTPLNIQMSNGEFYYLSNEKIIGWLKKWERNY